MMDSNVTKSPKNLVRKTTDSYSSCMLYDDEVKEKLKGIAFATYNPNTDCCYSLNLDPPDVPDNCQHRHHHYHHKHVISEKMACNCCSVEFSCRHDQRDHYKSDWHRYNLKLKLKALSSVSEEDFERIAGDVSSISGSEESSDSDAESDRSVCGGRVKTRPMPIPGHVHSSPSHSGTDSESETSTTWEWNMRKYPKVYFRNMLGEILSLYRCLLYHKKKPPSSQSVLLTTAVALPQHTKWAIFMAAGGHFAGAVFDGETLVTHKTFHRYVVRAKRGSAQGSRDSQGNAPRSAGASLRRYNEAALAQEVQDLIVSWSDHIKKCDLIFLRAPSFNRPIFYGGKNALFKKDDTRIRTIPFATRRPTLNEVKRVYQMLASVEFYGNESDIKDFIPVSPVRRFSHETGKLEVVSDDKLKNLPWRSQDKDNTSLLAASPKRLNPDDSSPKNVADFVKAIPDHVIQDDSHRSSSTSASETELVEVVETSSTLHLQEFDHTPKPRKKKSKRKRHPSKHQLEPDGDVFAEEKYHLRNSLYTACKVGDVELLKNLLAVFKVMSGNKDGDDVTSVSGNREPDIINSEVLEQNSNVEEHHGGNSNKNSVDNCENVSHDMNQMKSADLVENASSTDTCDKIPSDSVNSVDFTHDNTSVNCPQSLVPEVCVKNTENEDATDLKQAPEEGNQSIPNTVPVIQEKDPSCDTYVPSGKSNSSLKKPSLLSSSPSRQKSEGTRLSELSPLMAADILNEPFGDNETTLLHVSSRCGHSALISLLLNAGADPSVREKSGKVPYFIASTKETRNEFRRFMASHPDKYDYVKAQVPCPLTADMEAERKQKDLEKKKILKKIKNEKMKEKKAEMAIQRKEVEEQRRFLSLSDREKRALVADKRLVEQLKTQGEAVPVLSRCWQCGSDMTGKIPFQYFDYKFCNSKCLQTHRKQAKS
ncbi:ankyrin repeat and zinc finger domain-containing protein 1-like [Gigantopelta aegis]|uniref:ankyrin repeat and zinc finger domain-containing protein 1-like n=1 Tax=Gigantopelta aegis TaxID=1735272 RepID=UPI001B88C01F|nr:ankyrin repeat and zinc finger domain-containing protein 1-like [Gigantopelta aegis]